MRETQDNPLAWIDSRASRLEIEILDGLLRDVEGPRILEVGAGRGRLIPRLARQGRTVVAVEPREEYVREARTRGALYRDVHWCVADGHALPFADASFTAVVLIRVLHLSADPFALLCEVRRVLCRDGVLIASFYPEPSWRTFDHGLWNAMRRPSSRASRSPTVRTEDRQMSPPRGRPRSDRSAAAIEGFVHDAGFRQEVRLGAGLEELTGWKLLPDGFIRGLRRAMPEAPIYPCWIAKFRSVRRDG